MCIRDSSGTKNWTEVRQFNLMFSTEMGSTSEGAMKIYLRPETAQGIFVNYLNVQKTGRMKVPFGIAQIGNCLLYTSWALMLYLPSTFVMVPTFVAPLTATDTPGNGSSLPSFTNPFITSCAVSYTHLLRPLSKER